MDKRCSLAAGILVLALGTASHAGDCPLLPDNPKALDEPEACGQDVNGGCDMAKPAFTPIDYSVYRGTAWFDGDARDTDWYQFEDTGPGCYWMQLVSETTGFVLGVLDTQGSGDCADAVSFLATDVTDPCLRRRATLNGLLQAGVWWVYVAPSITGDVVECGDHDTYDLYFGSYAAPLCWADFDASYSVGFSDLLELLAHWGTSSLTHDLDDDGSVGFSDLMYLLAFWGPCPCDKIGGTP